MPGKHRQELPPGTLNTPSAARVAGLHWRTLLRWRERGLLDPICFAAEPGSHAASYAWPLHVLVAARTIAELRAKGVSAQAVRKAAKVVARYGKDLASARLVVAGDDVFMGEDAALMSVLLKPGQHQLFDVAPWAAETARAFRRESRGRKVG
jgi:hypothetical protein